MAIPKETLLKMYRNLLTARRLDERLGEIYSAGGSGMPWLHRRIGEEAIPIAVCANLRKDDYLHLSCVRGRPGLFAKGFTLAEVIAGECCRDTIKVGWRSREFCPEYGLLAFTGALGEDVLIYTGAALSAMIRKSGQVSVCISGDGASNRGSVHEAMVMAAALHLPIVFGIENNQYAASTAVHKSYAVKDLSDRAKAYGFPGQSVDGNDVIATYEVVKEYVDRARNGGGPGLIVFETYRLRGHSEGDTQIYRPKGEVEEWWKKDPLLRYQKRLMEMGILTENDVSKLEKEIKTELDEATKAALAVPHPTVEDLVKTAIDEL